MFKSHGIAAPAAAPPARTRTAPASVAAAKAASGGAPTTTFPPEAKRIIEMQREEIRRLRDTINKLTDGPVVTSRPVSRERLPPMEGFSEA